MPTRHHADAGPPCRPLGEPSTTVRSAHDPDKSDARHRKVMAARQVHGPDERRREQTKGAKVHDAILSLYSLHAEAKLCGTGDRSAFVLHISVSLSTCRRHSPGRFKR